MRTEVTTVAETDRIMFGYWDADKEEFIELRYTDSETNEETAEKFGCSPLLIDALIILTDGIAKTVGKDLKDIWKRIN